MSFVLLHAATSAALYVDDPIVPARDVARFDEAADLLAAATALRDEARGASVEIQHEARERGHAEGLAAGRAAAEAELSEQLARYARAEAERIAAQRGDLASLAIEVIRRVAGEVGTPDFVAGLAASAAADVAADRTATVYVHAAAAAATAERLRSLPLVTVEVDSTLAEQDCVIETALGRTVAGLDAQLDRLRRAWEEPAVAS